MGFFAKVANRAKRRLRPILVIYQKLATLFGIIRIVPAKATRWTLTF